MEEFQPLNSAEVQKGERSCVNRSAMKVRNHSHKYDTPEDRSQGVLKLDN